jgi:hypothetical protein
MQVTKVISIAGNYKQKKAFEAAVNLSQQLFLCILMKSRNNFSLKQLLRLISENL